MRGQWIVLGPRRSSVCSCGGGASRARLAAPAAITLRSQSANPRRTQARQCVVAVLHTRRGGDAVRRLRVPGESGRDVPFPSAARWVAAPARPSGLSATVSGPPR